MNKEHVAGKAEEIKGVVKEKLGFITNDSETEGAGLKDQLKGKVRQAHGDAIDAKDKIEKVHKP